PPEWADVFFQAEDGIRGGHVTGVQTCALPISSAGSWPRSNASGAASVRSTVSLDDSVALVRRYVDALNSGDLAALDELFADDFEIGRASGREIGEGLEQGACSKLNHFSAIFDV